MGPGFLHELSGAEVRKRYSRQMLVPSFGGPRAQCGLRKARVLVVGAGGLGCSAILYLAGAGVGRLQIMDGDAVEQSNLHRQVMHTDEGAEHGVKRRRRLLAALSVR